VRTPTRRFDDIMRLYEMIDVVSKRLFKPAFSRPRLDSAEGARIF
jgi:hypothetical protein